MDKPYCLFQDWSRGVRVIFRRKKTYSTNSFKEDFPSLGGLINNAPPIYFDNACMSLRPKQMVEAMNKYYFEHPACARRSAHAFGLQTTKAVESARRQIAEFFSAGSENEIIFTRNATDSINIIATGIKWLKGDKVITSNLEHNSNTLPWMQLSENQGIEYLKWEITPEGEYDLDSLYSILETGKIKLLSLVSSSHVMGLRLPIERIIEKAHKHGTLVLVDAAQSMLHEKIDVSKWKADFVAISFHKALGPSGMGCLIINEKHFDKIHPQRMGGETVDNVTDKTYQLSKPPYCYEPGLQDYAGILGAAAACAYIEKIGFQQIQEKEKILGERLFEILNSVTGVTLLGNKKPACLANFYLGDLDAGELSILLNKNANIMTRSGVHCCHAWYNHNKLDPSLRISLAFYNSLEELDALEIALKDLSKFYS